MSAISDAAQLGSTACQFASFSEHSPYKIINIVVVDAHWRPRNNSTKAGEYSGHDRWLRKQLIAAVNTLQSRDAQRRGPFDLTDADLKEMKRELDRS